VLGVAKERVGVARISSDRQAAGKYGRAKPQHPIKRASA
jgi:hypothetical protein